MKVLITLWLVVFFLAGRMWLEDHRWLRARKRSREPGLNTEADADAFVEVLRADDGVDRLTNHLSPLEHNDTTVHVPRVRTTPLVTLGIVAQPLPMRRTVEPVFAMASTPIFDQLERDIKARRRALRWPTAEMRGLFDQLVERWLCTFCEYERCRGCPGCSCECRMAVAA